METLFQMKWNIGIMLEFHFPDDIMIVLGGRRFSPAAGYSDFTEIRTIG